MDKQELNLCQYCDEILGFKLELYQKELLSMIGSITDDSRLKHFNGRRGPKFIVEPTAGEE